MNEDVGRWLQAHVEWLKVKEAHDCEYPEHIVDAAGEENDRLFARVSQANRWEIVEILSYLNAD